MVLVSWQSSALQMARYRRGVPQTPAGSRINPHETHRPASRRQSRSEQHRQSPEGNRRHCGHTPLRMRLGAKCEPEAQKCSHSTRVLKKLYPSRASTAGRMGNVPDTGVHVRTMCSKILLLGPLDVARRNQSNRMPKLHQLASPVMGRRARLHTNKTRGKPPEDPISAGGEVAERAKSCPDRTPNEITKEGAYDE